MTNQKTPVQGCAKLAQNSGATEEQIEAGARAYDPEAWAARDKCAAEGSATQTELDLMVEYSLAKSRVILSAAASAHPADERHDAEEREAERCDDDGCLHYDHPAESEDHAATVTGAAGPSEARIARARDVIDRTFGWKHLRKYGRMSEEWMDKLRDGLARNVLAFEEIPAATVTGDREKLALDRVWKAMGCAWNPDAFKAGVRDTMWSQVVEFCEEQTAGNNRLYRENEELRTALAAPVEVDEAKLAELAYKIDSREWKYSPFGITLGRQMAELVEEWLRGEGR